MLPRTLLACLLLLAVCAVPAQANKAQTMTFEAPHELMNPKLRDAAFAEIASLGARQLRVILYWRDVSPSPKSARRPAFDATNPAAYNWGQYDAILAGAAQRGWPVLLTVSGPVPRWATRSKRDFVSYPNPTEFRRFMTAVERHYGAQVKTFAVWNEPNHPAFLGPQYSRKGHRPLSPATYRSLFLAAFKGMRDAGVARPRLLMGETAPRGTGKDVAPLTFLRGALCLDARYRKSPRCSNLPTVGYAHHAYTTRLGPFFKPPGPNDVTIGVLGRLTRALDLAARAGAVDAGLPIYLTEFGIQSFPDRLLGVPPLQQAEFYAISERLAYYNPRVVSFSQYLLRDDGPTSKRGVYRYGGFESGLRYANGRVKPAEAAFRLPLAVVHRGGRVTLWGRVRPATAPTTAEVQVSDRGGRFRHLLTVHTNAVGVFSVTSGFRARRTWRLRWTASDGRVYTGTPIRAYTSSGT